MSDKSPEPSPERKRRRVLSEIGNTEEVMEKTLNTSALSSLENNFDSAPKSIHIISVNTENTPDSMQRPSSAQTISRGSGIPTIRKNQQFERYLSVSESLNRKSRINSSSKDSIASENARPVSRQHQSRLALAELTHESERLDYEIEIATKKLNSNEEEIFAMRKLHRALRNEISTLINALEEQKSKFDYLSEQITTRVELKERELELELKDKRIKAESTYEDVKHEIMIELEQALIEGKSNSEEELALLETEKRDLEKKLEEIDAQIETDIFAEKAALKAERDEVVAAVDAEICETEKKLENLLLKQREIEEHNLKIEAQMTLQDKEMQQNTSAVAVLESNIQGYISQNAQLQVKLDKVTEMLRVHEARKRDAYEEEQAAKVIYEETKRKFDTDMRMRRRLEHAIFKIKGQKRAFVRVKTNTGNSDSLETCAMLAQRFSFDKVTSYRREVNYSLEWELLTQEALLGAKVYLFYLGLSQSDMGQQLADIYSFLRSGSSGDQKELELTFYFQSVLIKDHDILVDLLNSSSEVLISTKNGIPSVTSQRMLLKNVSEIPQTLEEHIGFSGAYVHVFSMEGIDRKTGNTVHGSVTVVDISQLPLSEQCRVLKLETNMKVLLQQEFCQTSLDICDIADPQDPDTETLLMLLNRRVSG